MLQLALVCFHDSHSDIRTARPNGSELMNVTNSPADEHSPACSPDGSWLALVLNRNDDVDIYKMCVTCTDEPKEILLTDEARDAGWLTWSPDGGWVAYADVPGSTLMLVRADRSHVAFFPSSVFSPPIWGT